MPANSPIPDARRDDRLFGLHLRFFNCTIALAGNNEVGQSGICSVRIEKKFDLRITM
jgi:hypothetical protein